MSLTTSFLTGVVAMVIGSELNGLISLYNKPIETIVLFGSGAALGRIVGCTFAGKVVKKIGPIKSEILGNIFTGIELLLIVLVPNYYFGMFCAFMGGMGMAFNDNSTPPIIAYVFPDKYSSMLSAGQTMYCFGNFAITLLLSLFLRINVPYYYSNFVCGAMLIISLGCGLICFNHKIEYKDEDEKVKPIYSKDPRLTVMIIALGSFAYCAVCNCVGLYTSSYLESTGLSAADSAFLLTIYNIGSTVGSILFIYILRKVSERVVMIMNSVISLVALSLSLYFNTYISYFIGLFIAGLFLGVMFAIILALATRISYKDPTAASSLVGIAGGLGDIVIPLITSALLTSHGIAVAYNTSLFFLILTLSIACAIYLLTKEKTNA